MPTLAYTAPTATTGGCTFAQLQTGGYVGVVNAVAAASSFTSAQLSAVNAALNHPDAQAISATISSWLSGYPVDDFALVTTLQSAAATLRALAQAVDDAGNLVVAHPGTIGSNLSAGPPMLSASGYPVRRTWP